MAAEQWFIGAGIALGLFSLWAIARHDVIRLTRPRRRALAQVIGHRASWSDGSPSHAAIYSFGDEAGQHDVIDQVYHGLPRPPLGTMIELCYPVGRPDLARPPRPLLWLWVYAVLLFMVGLLLTKALGWLE